MGTQILFRRDNFKYLKKLFLFVFLSQLTISLVSCALHGTRRETFEPSVQNYALIMVHATRIIHQNHQRGADIDGIGISLNDNALLAKESFNGKSEGRRGIEHTYLFDYVETVDARLARAVRTSVDYNNWVSFDWDTPYAGSPFGFDRTPADRKFPLPEPLTNEVGSAIAAGEFTVQPRSNGLTYFLKTIGLGAESPLFGEEGQNLKVTPVGLGYFPVEEDGTSGYFKGFYPSFDVVNGSPVTRLDPYNGQPLPPDLKIEVEGRPDPGNLDNVTGIIRVDIILGNSIQESFQYGEFKITNWKSEDRKLDFEIYNSPRSL